MTFLFITLTICGCYFEYKIVNRFPRFGKWLGSSPVSALIFSTTLSACVGAVFGAAGVIVFIAALASTVLMQPYYAMQNNGQWDQLIAKKNLAKDWSYAYRDEAVFRVGQLWKIVILAFKLIAIPFRVLFFILDLVMPKSA